MKAFVRDKYGSPDVLELKEIDSPVLKDGEVLVRVRAASLNQGDLDYLYGKPFLTRIGTGLRKPRNRGLGFDAAGQVEAVGKDITRFQQGDEVFGDLLLKEPLPDYPVIPGLILGIILQQLLMWVLYSWNLARPSHHLVH